MAGRRVQKSKSGFKGLKYTRSRWPSQKKAANFYIEASVQKRPAVVSLRQLDDTLRALKICSSFATCEVSGVECASSFLKTPVPEATETLSSTIQVFKNFILNLFLDVNAHVKIQIMPRLTHNRIPTSQQLGLQGPLMSPSLQHWYYRRLNLKFNKDMS